VPTELSIIIAGIVAIASLTMNTTIYQNGILMSVTTTSLSGFDMTGYLNFFILLGIFCSWPVRSVLLLAIREQAVFYLTPIDLL